MFWLRYGTHFLKELYQPKLGIQNYVVHEKRTNDNPVALELMAKPKYQSYQI